MLGSDRAASEDAGSGIVLQSCDGSFASLLPESMWGSPVTAGAGTPSDCGRSQAELSAHSGSPHDSGRRVPPHNSSTGSSNDSRHGSRHGSGDASGDASVHASGRRALGEIAQNVSERSSFGRSQSRSAGRLAAAGISGGGSPRTETKDPMLQKPALEQQLTPEQPTTKQPAPPHAGPQLKTPQQSAAKHGGRPIGSIQCKPAWSALMQSIKTTQTSQGFVSPSLARRRLRADHSVAPTELTAALARIAKAANCGDDDSNVTDAAEWSICTDQ